MQIVYGTTSSNNQTQGNKRIKNKNRKKKKKESKGPGLAILVHLFRGEAGWALRGPREPLGTF